MLSLLELRTFEFLSSSNALSNASGDASCFFVLISFF